MARHPIGLVITHRNRSDVCHKRFEDEGLPYEEEAPRKGVFPLFLLLSIFILKRVLFKGNLVLKKIVLGTDNHKNLLKGGSVSVDF